MIEEENDLERGMEDIARRYRSRPGFRLADYAEVGLPVYRLTIQGFVLARKPISPIEEFILKAIDVGLGSVKEIGDFLGLETQIVEDGLATLVQNDDAYLMAGAGERFQTLALTQKGRQTLARAQTIFPEERTLQVNFDGLTRKPIASSWFSKGVELRQEGIREISPHRSRPDVGELKLNEVEKVIRQTLGEIESGRTLLAIKGIERRDLFFQKAVALVYTAVEGDDVQVGFAVDGRISPDHEAAFAKADGPRKSGIIQEIRCKVEAPEDAIAKECSQDRSALRGYVRSRKAVEIAGGGQSGLKLLHQVEVEELQSAASKALGELQEARVKAGKVETSAEKAAADEELKVLAGRLAKAEAALASIPVRQLEVYEHAPLLERALIESKERLLIISPWIRAKVVNKTFVRRLEGLLRRGVLVYIGYGLGEEEDRANPSDVRAEEDLEKLSNRYENFKFVRLGDTHAKVLISDREFWVNTSFNWLSFKGDPNRTFRDERGTYVGLSEQIDKTFFSLVGRFEP